MCHTHTDGIIQYNIQDIPWQWCMLSLNSAVCCQSSCASHRDSGYFVRVPRLLVYMCPPTSMWTGALVLVSLAAVGMPAESRGDTEKGCRDDKLLLLLLLHLTWGTTHTHNPNINCSIIIMGQVVIMWLSDVNRVVRCFKYMPSYLRL